LINKNGNLDGIALATATLKKVVGRPPFKEGKPEDLPAAKKITFKTDEDSVVLKWKLRWKLRWEAPLLRLINKSHSKDAGTFEFFYR
jgi:hypothetical protein